MNFSSMFPFSNSLSTITPPKLSSSYTYVVIISFIYDKFNFSKIDSSNDNNRNNNKFILKHF